MSLIAKDTLVRINSHILHAVIFRIFMSSVISNLLPALIFVDSTADCTADLEKIAQFLVPEEAQGCLHMLPCSANCLVLRMND